MSISRFGKLALLCAVLGFGVAQAQQIGTTWDKNTSYFTDSLASHEAIDSIKASIIGWVKAHEGPEDRAKPFDEKIIEDHKAEFVAYLNGLLEKEKLPKINATSPDLKVKAVVPWHRHNSDFWGISVVDDKTKFCFPCEVGYNNTIWGVIPYAEAPRNKDGKNYKALSCFEAMDKVQQHENDSVNTYNRPGVKFIAIPGRNAGRMGFYAITDDGAYFYPAALPGGYSAQKTFHEVPCPDNWPCAGKTVRVPNEPLVMARSFRITLPNGVKTQVLLRIGSEHDDAHPEIGGREHVNAMEIPYDQGITDPDGTKPADLGTGAGDKLGPEADAAIRSEAVKRLVELERDSHGKESDPYSDLRQLQAHRDDLCSALTQCQGTGNFNTGDLTARFTRLESAFSCPDASGTTQHAENRGAGSRPSPLKAL
jgi:hypothetical protein